MGNKKPVINYVYIDSERINHACDAFMKWKDLNTFIKTISTRGINMPDALSEVMGCYCLGFLWNRGNVPGDATDKSRKRKIEFKATSNFDSDLSSFGPETYFDDLYFLRFDLEENKLYIYDLGMNSETFANTVMVNSKETVRMQQQAGRRPRVRIIESIIEPRGLKPMLVFDIRRVIIEKYEE